MDRIKNEVTNISFKSLAVFTLSLITAIGCLPRNQQVDQMYDGGSNLTSVLVEAPRSEKLSYNRMKLVLRGVDDEGKATDSVYEFDEKIPEGSENVKMETTVYSDKYKVSLEFIDVAAESAESTVVASSDYCKGSYKAKNSEIQNIAGITYSLEIFVCTPDGTQNVKTEKDTTDVVIKPKVVPDADEEKADEIFSPELSSDKLEQGQMYIFKVKSDDAEYSLKPHFSCLLSKGQEIRAEYMGTNAEQKYTIGSIFKPEGKNVEGKETDCPLVGRIKVKDVVVKPFTFTP